MSIKKWFTEHPASVNETYWEHFLHAMSFSLTLFKAAFACLVHALFPALCVKTGSNIICELHDRMVINRVKNPPPEQNECVESDKAA